MTQPQPLTDLTDADIMLNLYLTVIMALHVTNMDAAEVELSVTRCTDTDDTAEQLACLQDLMTEVERRLEIDTSDIDVDLERVQ